MVRILLAVIVGAVVTVGGVALIKALEVGGVARFGVLLVALLAVSMIDRERFYGPRLPHTRA